MHDFHLQISLIADSITATCCRLKSAQSVDKQVFTETDGMVNRLTSHLKANPKEFVEGGRSCERRRLRKADFAVVQNNGDCGIISHQTKHIKTLTKNLRPGGGSRKLAEWHRMY